MSKAELDCSNSIYNSKLWFWQNEAKIINVFSAGAMHLNGSAELVGEGPGDLPSRARGRRAAPR